MSSPGHAGHLGDARKIRGYFPMAEPGPRRSAQHPPGGQFLRGGAQDRAGWAGGTVYAKRYRPVSWARAALGLQEE